MTDSASTQGVAPARDLVGPALLGAWIVALSATLGALFIGEIMGQAPCDLCWYQRIFMFPLAILLAIAAFRGDAGVTAYALPLVAFGTAIAGFHSLYYAGLIPKTIEPCGAGPSCASAEMTILGVAPLPYLSLAAFIALGALLFLVRKASRI